MRSTTTPRRPRSTSQAFLFATRPDGPVVDADVLGEDAAGTMAFLVEQRRRQDVAAAQELRAVTHWADLHRALDDHGRGVVGAVAPDVHGPRVVGQPLLGREAELRLAGEGAFAVEEFAVTEIAAALGMSEPAARGYLGQALELRDRLPKCWSRVMNGDLPAWKGRRIAEETIPLNPAAAGYVDAHLAPFAHRLSIRRILRAVHAAIIRHDAALARERAAQAAERRGVWLVDELDGITELHAVTSTPDAHALDTALNTVAGALAALGDTDPDQVRRAKALGVLTDPQYTLDLTAAATLAESTGGPARLARRSTAGGPSIHVHLHTDAITGFDAVTRVAGGGIEPGPRPLQAVRQWLADLAPGARITLTPVVDLNEQISVDAYEIPDRLRAQITERDTGCVFPWCGRQGHHDLDHTDPYLPLDEGGPPGQTNTTNLARLCRFHHRVKTHGRWRYRRRDATTVEWTSPHGRTYVVDHTGTTPRTD